jgi:V8-like Glu-specific endopeptidase
MRFVPFVMILAVLVLGVASPAYAITNGSADGSEHPEVGALIAAKPYSDGTWAYCTGTLISPTVLLTAAHCGESKTKTVRVSFAAHYRSGADLHVGRYVADPRYEGNKSDLYDMAVVVFDTPVANIAPAKLPALGMLDRLKAGSTLASETFTPVGYGALAPKKGRQGFSYNDTRNRTSISFDALTPSWLQLSLNRSSDGSTCYGDSGGPNFLGGTDSDLLAATSISGDDNACKATNFDYRLDTVSARQFLGKYVTLP